MVKKNAKQLEINRQISSIKTQKRLNEIQKIKKSIDAGTKEKNKISRLGKIAYILWRYPHTRNSDITLAIAYYKLFHPELVENDCISFKNLYNLPKMYDIQRARAEIQNSENLFPADEAVSKMRLKLADEYKMFYVEKKKFPNKNFSDYYIYLDESGKNEKYFVLGGIAINGEENNSNYIKELQKIKSKIEKKYSLHIDELKFSAIKNSTLGFYKELISEIFKLSIKPIYYSVFLENTGLSQSSKKHKSNKLLEFMILDTISLIIQDTVKSVTTDVLVNLSVCLDEDGDKTDILKAKEHKKNIQIEMDKQYEYFAKLKDLYWQNSKDNILIQLADLYASSLNNIFSDIEITSETAIAKKDFAKMFLELVGIKDIDEVYKKNKDVKLFNNCIVKKTIINE